MNKGIVLVIVVLVLVGLGFYLVRNSMNSDSGGSGQPPGNSGGSTGEAKTFVITGENFKFMMNGQENPDLRVKEGDKVRIEFSSVGGFHDWKVDEFSAATEKVNDGQSTSVEFVANQKGTFEYYCSVGEHRQMGMRGNLIVE